MSDLLKRLLIAKGWVPEGMDIDPPKRASIKKEYSVNETPRDYFDREIRVGDICVYPVRKGSQMWINRITVQRIDRGESGFKVHGVKGDGYPVVVSTMDRLTIVGRDNVVPFKD